MDILPMYTFLYLFAFFRYFIPIEPFYISYFIETKKLNNNDIINKAIPWLFVSSLFVSIFSSLLSRKIGNKICLLLDTIADILVQIILCCMNNKNIFFAALSCGFHGISTSLAHISQCIVYEIEPNNVLRNKVMGKYQVVRKIAQIISSFIAQNLRYGSGNNISSLYLSLLSITTSLIFGVFLKTKAKKEKTSFIEFIYENGFKKYILSIYTPKVLFYSLINILASIIYISFEIYSNSIFIERKRNQDIKSIYFTKILNIILYPLELLSFVIIKFLSCFDRRIIYQNKNNDNILLFGYIQGLCKLVSAIVTYFVSSSTFESYVHKTICIILVILIVLFTSMLRYFTSLLSTYIFYMAIIAFSTTLLRLSHTGYNKENSLEEITSTNLFISSIIHVAITYISKYKKSKASEKMYYYYTIAVVIFAISLGVLTYENNVK
ncbi:hypothetical protein SLOPH_1824 [Spraguea lophii 42_110]|uniref:Uncharacterized protein n=1 Tax=Spraguea lophii (strain 42_110) TaxID=1358809 RepID=S7WCI2_SPRLO|nr:hypothetical protein SLOPH_1824 [Spraguea lophii 42_110]